VAQGGGRLIGRPPAPETRTAEYPVALCRIGRPAVRRQHSAAPCSGQIPRRLNRPIRSASDTAGDQRRDSVAGRPVANRREPPERQPLKPRSAPHVRSPKPPPPRAATENRNAFPRRKAVVGVFIAEGEGTCSAFDR